MVNGHMAAPASATTPVLFGNFAYYGIRTVSNVEIFRFMDSAHDAEEHHRNPRLQSP